LSLDDSFGASSLSLHGLVKDSAQEELKVRNVKTIKQRILEHLNATDFPSHVEDIRFSCGVGNWNTALKHCLELVLSNQVQGKRTSNGWIFWIDKEASKN
jgi:hypothetical protein